MSEYYLVHSRTKGSKNGVRLYQYTDGTWTEEGKRRRRAEYGSSDGEKKPKATVGQKIAAKKKHKQQVANLEKARKAKADKKAAEEVEKKKQENKEKVLKSGSAKEVLAYKGQLTNQEYNEVLNRLDNEAKLMAKANGSSDDYWKKIEKTANNLSTLTKLIASGTALYNASAKVINTFSDQNLKIIGGKKDEKTEKGKDFVEKLLGDTGDNKKK